MPRPLSSPIEESYGATTKNQNHAILNLDGRVRTLYLSLKVSVSRVVTIVN